MAQQQQQNEKRKEGDSHWLVAAEILKTTEVLGALSKRTGVEVCYILQHVLENNDERLEGKRQLTAAEDDFHTAFRHVIAQCVEQGLLGKVTRRGQQKFFVMKCQNVGLLVYARYGKYPRVRAFRFSSEKPTVQDLMERVNENTHHQWEVARLIFEGTELHMDQNIPNSTTFANPIAIERVTL